MIKNEKKEFEQLDVIQSIGNYLMIDICWELPCLVSETVTPHG